MPDLAGPYRLGQLIARDFEPSTLARLIEALTGDEIELLADQATRASTERGQVINQLATLRLGITD